MNNVISGICRFTSPAQCKQMNGIYRIPVPATWSAACQHRFGQDILYDEVK